MLHLIGPALFLPLLGFLGLIAASRSIGRTAAGLIACSTIAASFLCFVCLLLIYTTHALLPQSLTLFSWIPVESIQADFTLWLDPLSLVMSLIITGVGSLIHVYSIGYMDHEEDFPRYFALLNFFVFAMLLLVLAGHLLLLFVGWEGVGLASYLLIGFWYDRPAAAQAATKAFVVNRVGDLGLLLGLLLTFHTFGTGDIAQISQQAAQQFLVGAPLLTVLTLLFFFGATAKSAQIPLHTWLPDAMEGPTPVSALIHAATMVTAGVYLLVRMHAVFILTPTTLLVVGVIGAITSLYAALCAIGQNDLKRVLAYSTVSQLGLMFLACGVGAFYAAIFHLTTHAFMKALLFLSAGNVVHMMHGTTDMNQMGGLRAKFPKTHWLFLIGVLAMSGVPPLAAFFSKDLILEQEYLSGFVTLYVIGLLASILTAFYLMRAYCLTFLDPTYFTDRLKEIREAPSIMLAPVAILATLSVVGGFLGFAFGKTTILEAFLGEIGVTLAIEESPNSPLISPEDLIATLGGLTGLIAAAWLYTRYRDRLGSPIPLLQRSFYIDHIYDTLIARPLAALSRWIGTIVEPRFFDRSIRMLTEITQKVAQELQRAQSGQIRSYVAWMVFGTVFLLAYLVL